MSECFATYAAGEGDWTFNYLLAKSLREFGGAMSALPILLLHASDLPADAARERFRALNVELAPFPRDRRGARYAFKPAAASACEREVGSGAVYWLDRHMIALGEPSGLRLPDPARFLYHPPHVSESGSPLAEPLGGAWRAAARVAGVSEAALFPMETMADGRAIRACFSAGHFAFRAEAGVMRSWDALFRELLINAEIGPFLSEGWIRTYLHQIALTLAALRELPREGIARLPKPYGYPAHLHAKIAGRGEAGEPPRAITAYYRGAAAGVPRAVAPDGFAAWLRGAVEGFRGEG